MVVVDTVAAAGEADPSGNPPTPLRQNAAQQAAARFPAVTNRPPSEGQGVAMAQSRGRTAKHNRSRPPATGTRDITMMQEALNRTAPADPPSKYHVNRGSHDGDADGTGYVTVDALGVGHVAVEHGASPGLERQLVRSLWCVALCCVCLLVLGTAAGVGAYMWWRQAADEDNTDGTTSL